MAHVLDTYRECGHVIGLHGDRHRPFRSAEHAAGELSRCAERISDYLGGTDVVPPAVRHGRLAGSRLRRPGRLACAGTGLGHHLPPRADGGRLRGCHRQRLIRHDGGIVLLHDFAAATEFTPAGLTEADLDLRIIEITTLLIERLRGAGFSFVGLPEPGPAARQSRRPGPAGAGAGSRPRRARRRAGLRPPAAAAVPRRTRRGAAEDLQTLRLFRATAKAAGGILDLVMPMRVGGDGPALFCAHPLVGLSWCYLALLPHVDARYPLYGLQARGLRRPEPLPASMAGDGAGLRRPDPDDAAIRSLPSARLVAGREHRLRDRGGTRAPR